MHVVVPLDVRKRVNETIARGIEKACAHYGVPPFEMPKVMYEKRGSTAGVAYYTKWEINFNGPLMMLHLEDFIARTVPHELAHLIVARIYPETHTDRGYTITRRGMRRGKRESHGPRFREVMAVLGCDDDSRCHSYDTSLTSKRKPHYKYQCQRCHQEFELGPKRHAKLRVNASAYTCKCHGALKLIADAVPVQVVEATVTIPHTGQQVTITKLNGASKWDLCVGLYRRHSSLSRGSLIKMFVEQAACTPAGAATYYAKCKSLYS